MNDSHSLGHRDYVVASLIPAKDLLPGAPMLFWWMAEKYSCVLSSLKSIFFFCPFLISIRNFGKHLCQEKALKYICI